MAPPMHLPLIGEARAPTRACAASNCAAGEGSPPGLVILQCMAQSARSSPPSIHHRPRGHPSHEVYAPRPWHARGRPGAAAARARRRARAVRVGRSGARSSRRSTGGTRRRRPRRSRRPRGHARGRPTPPRRRDRPRRAAGGGGGRTDGRRDRGRAPTACGLPVHGGLAGGDGPAGHGPAPVPPRLGDRRVAAGCLPTSSVTSPRRSTALAWVCSP